MAWHGGVRQGVARHGRHGLAWRGPAWLGRLRWARTVEAGQGLAGIALHDAVRQGVTRHGRRVAVWPDDARRRYARRDMADLSRLGSTWRGWV
jgi:hypothetical protein